MMSNLIGLVIGRFPPNIISKITNISTSFLPSSAQPKPQPRFSLAWLRWFYNHKIQPPTHPTPPTGNSTLLNFDQTLDI